MPARSTSGSARSGSSRRARAAGAVRPRAARCVARAGRRADRGRARRTAVESWFLPAPGDDPYVFVHVRDAARGVGDPPCARDRARGTRVTVPLAAARLPPRGRLRALVAQLVQLRPILEDASREVLLEQPGEPPQLDPLPASRARPASGRCSSTARSRSPRRDGADHRPSSRGAAAAQPLPRRPPRRPGGPLRASRARDDARRVRGPPRRPAPVRRGALRGDRAAAARRARRSRGPESSSRSTAPGSTSTTRSSRDLYAGDRPGAATDRRRRGAARGRASRRAPAR